MDHIPRVRNPVYQFPEVHYFEDARFKYRAPFEQYPEQFDFEALKTNKKNWQYTYTSFVQSWLFFGVLKEFFAIWLIPFREEDYIRIHTAKQRIITTTWLIEYILACVVQELNAYDECLTDEITIWWNSRSRTWRGAKARAGACVHILATARNALQDPWVIKAKDVDSAVWDSILILGSTLSRVTEVLFQTLRTHQSFYKTVHFENFRLRSIPDFRDSSSWCPRERHIVAELIDHSPHDIAFLGQIKRYEDHTCSHGNCTPLRCSAYQISKKAEYTPQHDSASCEGKCESLGFRGHIHSHTRAYRILSGTGVFFKHLQKASFLCYYNGQLMMDDLWMVKKAPEMVFSMRKFVAVSHVWRDGLGNLHANELPRCQVARIQRLVDDLYEEEERPVSFWMDTLMIPRTMGKAKSQALNNMEKVYKCASKILVLDTGLLQIDAEDKSPQELAARVFLSPWSRRLWTLQEGCIRERTYFQFRDTTKRWADLQIHIAQVLTVQGWKMHRSQLAPGHPLRDFQELTSVRQSGRVWKSKNARSCQVLDPVWPTLHRFATEMSSKRRANLIPGQKLLRALRSLYYRDCSKPEDEALVLSSFLHDSAESVAELAVVDSQERYRYLFKKMRAIPIDLLFVDQERYAELGSSWIPRTLLGKNSPSYKPPYRAEMDYYNQVCWQISGGVWANIYGLHLLPPNDGEVLPSQFQIKALSDTRHLIDKLQQHRWIVSLRCPGTQRTFMPATNTQWALIPEAKFRHEHTKCVAIFVKVLKIKLMSIEIQFSALADLSPISDEHGKPADCLPFIRTEPAPTDPPTHRKFWMLR